MLLQAAHFLIKRSLICGNTLDKCLDKNILELLLLLTSSYTCQMAGYILLEDAIFEVQWRNIFR